MRPPFALDQVTLPSAVDVLVRFADRYRVSPLTTNPARYEGSAMWLMPILPKSGSPKLSLRWPCTASVMAVDIENGPLTTLLEVTPSPFESAALLRSLPGGAPTFYIGYDSASYPGDHSVLRVSDATIEVTKAWWGIQFQDRLSLAPWAWFERFASSALADPQWRDWASALAPRRSLRLLDAQGRPYAGQSISFTNISESVTRVSDAGGEITGLPLQGSLRWQPSPATPANTLPLMSLVDREISNNPGENRFDLPSGFVGGHLQLVALSDWLAPNQHDDPASNAPGARFRTNSRMEPLVDGEKVFALLLEDLKHAKGNQARTASEVSIPPGTAYLAGWAFKDFPLALGDETTRLIPLLQEISQGGGQARVLASKFVHASDATLASLNEEAALIFLFLTSSVAPHLARLETGSYATSKYGGAIWLLIVTTIMSIYAYVKAAGLSGGPLIAFIREHVEQTPPEYLDRLLALNPNTITNPNSKIGVAHSTHPVIIDANPIATNFSLPDTRHIADLQNKFGVFHQKIQLLQYQTSTTSPKIYNAYIGGIDLNENRRDSPGHQGKSPFHDVHCRINGPAALEVYEVFNGRHQRDLGNMPAIALPTLVELVAQGGREVIQVAQTSFKPEDGGEGFAWAPQGNKTTHDTFVRSIKMAKELIYIEEQYLIPSDEYMRALEDAADHCQRLVIVLPSYLEVFFGDKRRGEFFERLNNRWGKRMLMGTPLRRPILAPPGQTTSKGRFTLLNDIAGPVDAKIIVGPASRVPSGRFFCWIGGELMLATGSSNIQGPDGGPAKQLEVIRGGLGTGERWCPNPRKHQKGESVTVAEPTAIFVHSKIIMVDDVFVAIGSTNINRRGFFHDGEITAFSIPQDLRSAQHNPARVLRTQLWAEQLGLPPQMGAALFADPIAGYELFRRSRYDGNRFVSLGELKVPDAELSQIAGAIESLVGKGPIGTAAALAIQTMLQVYVEAQSDKILNTVSDPTTRIGSA